MMAMYVMHIAQIFFYHLMKINIQFALILASIRVGGHRFVFMHPQDVMCMPMNQIH